MGKFQVRYLIEKPSGYYYRATPAMKRAGIFSEALGRNLAAAIARAERLNDRWDAIRKGDEKPEASHSVVFRGHELSVTSVAFTPDGRFVVSGSDDETVRVWSIADGTCTHTLAGHKTPIHAIAVSPTEQISADSSVSFPVDI